MSMSVEDRRSKWKAMMKEALHQAVVKVLAEDGLRRAGRVGDDP